MSGEATTAPTERELDILKILWDRGEATVREVYEQMSRSLPVVQNTVQIVSPDHGGERARAASRGRTDLHL